jgi:hypothetical protein
VPILTDDFAPEPEKKKSSSGYGKLCAFLSWGFLALTICWATQVHKIVSYIASEHYLLAIGVVSIVLGLFTVNPSQKSAVAHKLFVAANVGLVASIFCGQVWGWSSIIMNGEIYGAKFIVPAVQGLAIEAGIIAVIVCGVWHGWVWVDVGRATTTDRFIVSGFMALCITGLVFAFAICISVGNDARQKEQEKQSAKVAQVITDALLADLSGGAWSCETNLMSGVVKCVEVSGTPRSNS